MVGQRGLMRGRGRWSPATREAIEGYICIMPWLLGLIIFTLGPVLASFYFSLTKYELVKPPIFQGLTNYVSLFEDRLFYQSLKVTSIYTFVSVPLSMTLSFLVAMMLNQKLKLLGTLRTIYYLPNLIPVVASAMLWGWLLHPQFGLFNTILKQVFGIQGPLWLAHTRWALPSFIMMSLWMSIGGPMLIYLAGLQGIPTELYDAAAIDGANSRQQFRHVTIPQMTPVIFFNLIMGIIGSFQVFAQGYLMTAGGPRYATLFYVLYLYNNAFKWFKMGYASAMAWILFVIIMALTVLVFKSSAAWVYYSGELRGRR